MRAAENAEHFGFEQRLQAAEFEFAPAGFYRRYHHFAIGGDNFVSGLGSAAFVAYLSALCNVAYTATQYALLTSFMAVGRTLLSSGSGWLATQLGWVNFFVVSTGLAIPGLILLVWLMRLYPTERPIQAQSHA